MALTIQTEVLLALILGYLIPQFLKILFIIFMNRQRFGLKDLIVTGGMPSVHSSIVVSLATIIGLTEGFSTLFFVTLAFATIVLRDAMGVRRTAGEEGKIINQMISRANIDLPKLHYSLGHTPKEVIVGSFIGFIIAYLIYLF